MCFIPMRIIKRYSNRRLYDTDRRAYITHVELGGLVKSGEDFRIIDHATGEDITLPVLGQVLVEVLGGTADKGKARQTVIELINRGGNKSMSILKNTYLASVGMFNLTRKKAEDAIDSLIKAGDISKSERKEAVLELLDRAEKSTVKMKEKIVKESGHVQKDFGKLIDKFKLATRKDIEAINKKIDKLAQAIEKK